MRKYLAGCICTLMMGITWFTYSSRYSLGDDCPNEIFAEIECPIVGAPLCFGVKEENCNKINGVEFARNLFPSNPQNYQPLEGFHPTSPPQLEICYALCKCVPTYSPPPNKKYTGCEPDTSNVIQFFSHPVVQGSRCKQP